MALNLNDENSVFNFVVKEGNGIKGLVDLGLTEVPSLYIQPPHKRILKQQIVSSPQMATIDLSQLDGPNHDQAVKAIAQAAGTLGCFQVVNHGVPLELLQSSLEAAAHRFFGQPTEKKAVYLNPSPFVKHGTSIVPDIEKAPLHWRDYVLMTYTNDADALHFWPNECKEVALEYIKTTNEMVIKRLLKVLIGNLGVKLDDSRLDPLISSKKVVMNLYPPCPNPDLTFAGRHSDLDVLTVLQHNGVGGFYVKNDERSSPGNEEWIEVQTMDGALIVQVGDTLQILSNGRYKSAEHIVRTSSTGTRVSVPIFCSPLPAVKIGPFPELVARDGVARYKEVKFQEYMKSYFELPTAGKNTLDEFASI